MQVCHLFFVTFYFSLTQTQKTQTKVYMNKLSVRNLFPKLCKIMVGLHLIIDDNYISCFVCGIKFILNQNRFEFNSHIIGQLFAYIMSVSSTWWIKCIPLYENPCCGFLLNLGFFVYHQNNVCRGKLFVLFWPVIGIVMHWFCSVKPF